jgi:putative SOS response-associated peptidase YedK
MCNRYGYNDPLAALQRTFSELDHVSWDGAEPNAPLDQIRPTDRAPIVRPAEGGLELVMLRWDLVPSTWRGSLKAWTAELRGNPLTNARSEGVASNKAFREPYASGRCLVPASNYFEWTTDPERPKGRKLMWKFSVPDQPTFAFPGIWDHADTKALWPAALQRRTQRPYTWPHQPALHQLEKTLAAGVPSTQGRQRQLARFQKGDVRTGFGRYPAAGL